MYARLFVPCASNTTQFTDMLVEQRQSLIRITGHPMMDLTPDDATALAQFILKCVEQINHPTTYPLRIPEEPHSDSAI